MEVAEQALAQASGAHEPRRVQVFCWAILGAALAVGVALLLAGAARPALGPVFLLVLVVALCVNQFALFPSEHAATAEAAVLLAAVVGFRGEAVFIGPLLVGVFVGPLDVLHWQQGSILRMAHNAGNRGLSVLGASAAFVGVGALAGSSALALTLAVIVASAVFTTVDLLLSMTLLVLQGSTPNAAFRAILSVDALTLPIACYGAAVGFLAGVVGWWATALALVPVAFVPELVLTRVRWRFVAIRDWLLASATLATLVVLVWLGPLPDGRTLAALVAVGILAGLELGIEDRRSVAGLLALSVIAALVVVDGDQAFAAAALAAVSAAIAGWLVARGSFDVAIARTTATALSAALVAATIFVAAPTATSGGIAAMAAVVAGVVFEAVVVVIGATRRRRRLAEMFWTAPLLGVAVAAAAIWRSIGVGGAPVFAVLVAAALAGAARFGAPPWRSRLLARGAASWGARSHRLLLVITCGLTTALAVSVLAVHDHDARRLLVWLTVAVGEAGVAMSLVGIRQWTFAPRGRRRAAALLAVVGLLLVGVYPEAATSATRGIAALIALMSAAVVLLAGTQPARRADEAARARAGVGQ